MTNENKREYVDLVAEHRMTTAIRAQTQSYLKGYWEMVPKVQPLQASQTLKAHDAFWDRTFMSARLQVIMTMTVWPGHANLPLGIADAAV